MVDFETVVLRIVTHFENIDADEILLGIAVVSLIATTEGNKDKWFL